MNQLDNFITETRKRLVRAEGLLERADKAESDVMVRLEQQQERVHRIENIIDNLREELDNLLGDYNDNWNDYGNKFGD